MKKSLIKNAICFLMLLALMAPIMVAADDLDLGEDIIGDINLPGQGSNAETALPDAVVNVINIILGLLALIAIVIVLIGGFEWMTAGGNEDKVATARKRLTAGLIGLAIIFLAYAIVTFVLNRLGSII